MTFEPNPLATDLEEILGGTTAWDFLRGTRLFITGGTGFFGCWLLESWALACDRLQLESQAWVLTRDPGRFALKCPHLALHPAIRLHSGDIRDFDFPPGEFPFVIHAATDANAKLNEENPEEMSDTITRGTRRVLEFARQAATRRLLFTSSGAIYGPQPPALDQISETFGEGARSASGYGAYGDGKRQAELLCAEASRSGGMEVALARCFAFVGPLLPLDQHFAVGNFIRDALKGGPIQISGDGTPYRSYLYAGDLTIWLWTLLTRAPSLRPYNVGSPRRHTIAEIAEIVSRVIEPLTGKRAAIEVRGKPDPTRPGISYVPSIERAEAELGLHVTVPLDEAIRRTARWVLRES